MAAAKTKKKLTETEDKKNKIYDFTEIDFSDDFVCTFFDYYTINLYLLPILKFEKSLYWNINTKDFSEWIL